MAWLRVPDGTERKFTVHTREIPTTRGHEVTLITTRYHCQRVLAPAIWPTINGVNYARSESRSLVRVGRLPRLPSGFVGMLACLGDVGIVLSVPLAAVVLVAVAPLRRVARRWLAWRVHRSIDLEAWRIAKSEVVLH